MMRVMSIQAVVFDIGGVLEVTPDLGLADTWEARLALAPGELNKRMADAWQGGSIGTIDEAEVHRAATEQLGLDERQLAEFMGDLGEHGFGGECEEVEQQGVVLGERGGDDSDHDGTAPT
jgi:hypothetical protein